MALYTHFSLGFTGPVCTASMTLVREFELRAIEERRRGTDPGLHPFMRGAGGHGRRRLRRA